MNKKSALIIILSVILAVIFAAHPAAKAASETAENNKEYISEVKIGVGKTESEAASSLDGYTILKDNGKNVDLNQGAGGGIGSQGDRVVYLGYKTTTDRSEAITDLAVMNMKGGYSVKDYELLMEQYMTEQIIPFVINFLAVINEYRSNYVSSFEGNRARAKYVHDALNKLTDDDCGGTGLGDLLLNLTKYEMGDEAYEALPESEKKQHADILTIIAQANGQAVLLMETLLMRATDRNGYSWIERFVETNYDDMLALYTNLLPSDAEKEIAKSCDDDAKKLLSTWEDLRESLLKYNENTERIKELSNTDHSDLQSILDNYDEKTATEKQTAEYIAASAELRAIDVEKAALLSDVAIADYLMSIEYNGITLYELFTKDKNIIENEPSVLYPLVVSLSAGQRAGLDFISLSDLVMIAATDPENYLSLQDCGVDNVSIYENVEREIYKKGGVALTSDAMRAHSVEELAADGVKLGGLTTFMIGITSVCFIGLSLSVVSLINETAIHNLNVEEIKRGVRLLWENGSIKKEEMNTYFFEDMINEHIEEKFYAKTVMCNRLIVGFSIAFVVFSAISLLLTYMELRDYYKTEYTPIPKYMVDEADITAYNEKGEKTVIKNLSAYYKAVECNRASGDEWYDILGASADLNGTVGRQWLALYAAKNENMSPIVASSLKAVVNSDKIPTDYTTGIHMFGSSAAYNLNNTQFVWNNEAKSVYVYFNVDTSASESATTGSSFTAGYIIIAAVAGLIVGAAAAVCVTLALKNKKKVAA